MTVAVQGSVNNLHAQQLSIDTHGPRVCEKKVSVRSDSTHSHYNNGIGDVEGAVCAARCTRCLERQNAIHLQVNVDLVVVCECWHNRHVVPAS